LAPPGGRFFGQRYQGKASMKVHVLQHVPFEGLGSIQGWLEAHNAQVSFTRFFEDPVLPDVDDFDLVIVMGGPMSVNDERVFPWLIEEKRFIAAAVHTGKAVLGICLGAQLIASTLGGRVYSGPCKEIGWHEIQSAEHPPDSFRFPRAVIVFHWHGETFDLPQGAIRLAHSSACQNQAFQVDKRVIGLQFHLETTPKIVEAMISNCGDELVTGPYIQSASKIRNVPATFYVTINQLMGNILGYITR
jgi:GMP synthase-like glutamine amidotransferase